jgi:hypothetical protein
LRFTATLQPVNLNVLSAWATIILIVLACGATLVRYRLRWWTLLLCAIGTVLIISFFDFGN